MVVKRDFNDKSLKYIYVAHLKRQHQYLGLSGEYVKKCPHEVIYPGMEGGRMDGPYLSSEDIFVDIEEESGKITPKTKEKYVKYGHFVSYRYYPKKYHLVVICHQDPGKKTETIIAGPSVHIIIHYIYFSDAELLDKYEKLINKVDAKSKLSDMEALDIVHIPKYIDKKFKVEILDGITQRYEKIIIEDRLLRMDVFLLLKAMIEKHVSDEKLKNEFIGRIDMEKVEDEMYEIAREICEDEINELKEEKQKVEEERKNFELQVEEERKNFEKVEKERKNFELQVEEERKADRNKIDKLLSLKDLNTPEAKKILSSLMVMR